jgi:membrane-bound lytic murein transglycosylase A
MATPEKQKDKLRLGQLLGSVPGVILGLLLALIGDVSAVAGAPAVAPAVSAGPETGPDAALAVMPATPELAPAYDDRLWQERPALLRAIDHSLEYLETPAATAAYRDYPVPGVTCDRIRRSLVRFRQLVQQSPSPQALQQAVAQEFSFYQASGHDDNGTVDFTGYFEPTYAASRVPTADYRYPLYRRPANLDQWPEPQPTRLDLEGADGLQGSNGPLKGLELVWLKDRLDAFLVQVQGSARLQLTDGATLSIGYAGRTQYPYTSIGRALIEDGIIAEDELTLPVLLDYFRQYPQQLNTYLPRNNRFVFFRETYGAPAMGSLNVPVTAGRSIATDKTLMPPGALALIALELPQRDAAGAWTPTPSLRYVLDQDTGGAIRGPGRVDLFVGTGVDAGEVAGLINTQGQLYYLLLRE